MAKKKFNIPQKEHTVALSPDNVAARRAAPKPQGLAPEEQEPAVKLGPVMEVATPLEAVTFNPEAAPAVPSIIAAPTAEPVEVVKPVKPAKEAPIKTTRSRRVTPADPVRARSRATAPESLPAAPIGVPDPLQKRMPLASPSRSRMISLRARNAQLRQQLEQLELSNKARSRV
jgi:hypothetical protein